MRAAWELIPIEVLAGRLARDRSPKSRRSECALKPLSVFTPFKTHQRLALGHCGALRGTASAGKLYEMDARGALLFHRSSSDGSAVVPTLVTYPKFVGSGSMLRIDKSFSDRPIITLA